ncbi:MAG: MFS transporter [Armatimonadota bacterium]
MGFWKGRSGLYVVAFVLDMTLAAGGFAVPLHAIALGATPLQLGIIGSSPFAYTLACLFSGRLSDRLGRRAVAAVGCVLAGCGYFVIPHTPTLTALFGIVVSISFSMALIWPPVQAWLSEQPDRRPLSSSVGIFNVAWTVGLAAGLILGSGLAELDPELYLTCYAAGGLALFSILILYAIRADGRPVEDARVAKAPRAGTATFMYMSWVLNFASWFTSGCVRALLPKLTRETHVDDTTLGWLLASVMIGQTLMFVILQRTDKWQYRLEPLLLLPCGSAVGMLLLHIGGGPRVWALGLPLVGLACGMTYYGSLFYTLANSAKGRGRATGFHEAVLGGGILFGPLLGGASVPLSGGSLKAPYLLAAAVTMLTVIAAAAIHLKAAGRRRGDAEAE